MCPCHVYAAFAGSRKFAVHAAPRAVVVSVLAGAEHAAALADHKPQLVSATRACGAAVKQVGVYIFSDAVAAVGEFAVGILVDRLCPDKSETATEDVLHVVDLAKPAGIFNKVGASGCLTFAEKDSKIFVDTACLFGIHFFKVDSRSGR